MFIAVLLAIPFFFGRGLYRAFALRTRIEDEAKTIRFAQARIVGFTKGNDISDSIGFDHFAIVEYKTAKGEVIWAETLSCDRRDFELNSTVQIMYRPGYPRSVKVMPNRDWARSYVGFEKNFELVLVLLGIAFLLGSVLYYHGVAAHILGPGFAMMAAGFAFGHWTKGRKTPADRADAESYRSMCDRLTRAQARGVIPCELTE